MPPFSSHPLATGCPPAWASAWGQDQYGPWVALCVGEVEQCLRWIPPGRFLMGSPENEEGRNNDEGPRHEVQLTRGFWLFDTPCTQALWQVVMGENPSFFKENEWKNRPVEQVSWEEGQQFIARLNAQLPELAVALPTEAEWEYACRAGTDSARYSERLEDLAWYDPNSKGETHPVKEKRPNTWGLYDMLGNVAEWCHDGQRDYTAGAIIDPLGPTTPGAGRVIRGGDWSWGARGVRSAYRSAVLSGVRGGDLGFRCASSGHASRLVSREETDGARARARSETAPTDAGR